MTETPASVRDFTEVLREMEGGNVHYDLTEKLQALIASVTDTRKAGTLTLSMSVAPTGKNTVVMATDVKLKEPQHDRPATTFFVDGKFQLHRDDPRQMPMDLREADTPAEPLRETPQQPDEGQGLRVIGRDD